MLKIGHRGRPGYPRRGENTIRSFQSALDNRADALEFDVRKTKDNQIVIIHDETINRTTNGRGRVRNFTYDELRKFDAGFGEYIPLFSEILDLFGGKCLLNIELKERGIEGLVRATLLERGLQKFPFRKSAVISAFDADDNGIGADSSWEQLKIFAPDFPIALIASKSKIRQIGNQGFIEAAKEYGAKAINPEQSAVTADLVALAHQEGLLVWIWTVNDPQDVEHFQAIGVDGIFSDCVELLQST